MKTNNATATQTDDQYALAKILGIWLVGGALLWIIGWLVHPAMRQGLLRVDSGLL